MKGFTQRAKEAVEVLERVRGSFCVILIKPLGKPKAKNDHEGEK